MQSTPSLLKAFAGRLACLALLALLIIQPAAGPALAAPRQDSKIFVPLVSKNGPTPTSGRLIQQAQQAGRLSLETSLIYQVYALYGDSRLPLEYRGDDSHVIDSLVMLEVQENWNAISAQGQAILRQYLLPPGRSSRAPGAAAAEVSIAAMGGAALIWYDPAQPGDLALAQGLKTALETCIWAKETGLMGALPVSDAGSPQQAGPDGALDIYVVHNLPGALGLTIPIQRALPPTGAGCETWPTYVKILAGALGDDTHKGMVQVLAHEFMHTLQFSFHGASACSEYNWLREATATWAMDYTYPQADYEHDYAAYYLDHPERTLDTADTQHEYGAYLLPYFMTHQVAGSEAIRTIFENTRSMNSLKAVDQAVPKYALKDIWPMFALYAWNRAPYNQPFNNDRLTYQLKADKGGPQEVTVGSGEGFYRLDLPVEHLSTRYYHFKFSDKSANLITFFNGVNYNLKKGAWAGSDYGAADGSLDYESSDLSSGVNPGASVWALVKLAGKDWTLQIWSVPERHAFCRDDPDEQLEELVLIESNTDIQDRDNPLSYHDQTPVLWASNAGCGKWTGSATYVNVDDGLTITENTSNITFEDLVPAPAGYTWYAGTYPILQYKLTSADGTWQISGTDGSGCTHSGSGNFKGYHKEGSSPNLEIFPGILSGPSQRGMLIIGQPDPAASFTENVVCPDRSYTTQTSPYDFLETGLQKLAKLSQDGRTMDGSYTFDDANGTHTWTWHLTATSTSAQASSLK